MAKRLLSLTLILQLLLIVSCIEESGGPQRSSDISLSSTEESVEETVEEEEEEELYRPQGMLIDSGFCSCLNGEADSLGDCDSFCQTKSTDEAILFIDVSLGADIELNETFNSLKRWCETPVDNGSASPVCLLKLTDEYNSTRTLSITITDTTSATINVSELDFNKTYSMSLIVNGEESSVSNSKHFRRISSANDEIDSSTLKVTPVNSYKCINNSIDTSNNATINSTIQHFYYRPTAIPDPIASSNTNVYCHDIEKYGSTDSSSYPRLGLDPYSFYLWDMSDSRFYDLYDTDADLLDIHEYISLLLEEEYSYVLAATSINYFQELRWPNSIVDESDPSPMLGYYLQYSYDTTTKKTYCPTQLDFQTSSDPRERVLKYFIGVDTEALYWAQRDPETLENADGSTSESSVTDVMIVKESDVSKVWFYFENELPIEPNDTTISQHTIYFYYPYDFETPYTKKSHQKIYKIVNAEELSGTTDDSLRESYPSHDKRFGCAPKMDSD